MNSPPLAHTRSTPVTPDLRSRGTPGEFASTASSPTLSDSSASAFRLSNASRSSIIGLVGTPTRKVSVRSDPSIITCFDIADKELYDLWAPKK